MTNRQRETRKRVFQTSFKDKDLYHTTITKSSPTKIKKQEHQNNKGKGGNKLIRK